MALVQITEPPESLDTAAPPRPRRFAVGIDLGTTNSLVACMQSSSSSDTTAASMQARILAPAGESPSLPSAVYYQSASEGGGCLVGHSALAKAQESPHRVLTSIKRLLGRRAAEVRGEYLYDYRAEQQEDGGIVSINTAAGPKTPLEISADILRALSARALAASGEEKIDGAVITVPAYFDDAQRQATKDAARLAGLNVLRLLNEPTAAAVAYGLDHANSVKEAKNPKEDKDNSDRLYIVYDLGGGTFDVSLLRLSRGVFEVLATGGSTTLGGDDYDRALARFVSTRFAAQQAAKQATNQAASLSAADSLRLFAAARRAKETLTQQDTAVLQAQLQGGNIRCNITAAQFADITAALTQKTIACCEAVLRDAAIDAAAIDAVVLAGGATRMPPVRRAVASFFQRAPHDALNPDEVVALGAAAQAEVLIGNRRTTAAAENDWLLLDIIPLSLGLETFGGLAEKILHRNTTIPAEKTQEFTTHQDGQSAMKIHVVQGERELVADCRSLAVFNLTGIPPLAAGQARIQVTFRVDADGLLAVSARERTTGAAAGVEVKPSYGLSESAFANMLQSAYAHAKDDLQKRQWQEAKNDSEELLRALESALAAKADAALLTTAERATIPALIKKLRACLQSGEDITALNSAKDALQEASAAFAARRMNADIRRALAGKSVDDVT